MTRFVAGDDVFGIGRGSFAEFAVASEGKLAPKPAGLTFEQAAVVPVSGLAAIQALRDAGHIRPGQRVLIVGASGGVGSYAVQLAKGFGVAHNPKVAGPNPAPSIPRARSSTGLSPFSGTAQPWSPSTLAASRAISSSIAATSPGSRAAGVVWGPCGRPDR